MRRLKSWPEPFQAMIDEVKTFDFRKEDEKSFEIEEVFCFDEWNPGVNPDGTLNSNIRGYTGRKLVVVVTYILRGPRFDVPKGYVVLGVKHAV